MNSIINEFVEQQAKVISQVRNFSVPNFRPGDTVNVKYKISEGSNIRIQAFKGVVIAKTKSSKNYVASFTVRKISSSVGVERKFPLYSPLIADIEVLKSAVVRKAKLYYLRKLTGKASRLKEKLNLSSQELTLLKDDIKQSDKDVSVENKD